MLCCPVQFEIHTHSATTTTARKIQHATQRAPANNPAKILDKHITSLSIRPSRTHCLLPQMSTPKISPPPLSSTLPETSHNAQTAPSIRPPTSLPSMLSRPAAPRKAHSAQRTCHERTTIPTSLFPTGRRQPNHSGLYTRGLIRELVRRLFCSRWSNGTRKVGGRDVFPRFFPVAFWTPSVTERHASFTVFQMVCGISLVWDGLAGPDGSSLSRFHLFWLEASHCCRVVCGNSLLFPH